MATKKMCNLSKNRIFYSIIVILIFISYTHVHSYNPEHLARVLSGEKNLRNLDLDDANLLGKNLSDRDFTGSSMCRTKVQGSDLSRSILDRTNMTDINMQPLRESIYRPGFGRKIFYQLTNLQYVQCNDVTLATKKLRGAYFVGATGLTEAQQVHVQKYGAFLASPVFQRPNILKQMVLDDLGALSAGVNVYVFFAGHLFKVLDETDCCRRDSEKKPEPSCLIDRTKSIASQLKIF